MSFKCDRGPIFQDTNLNRNLTQFRLSKIHCQPDPTERNCSLRHVTIKNVFWSFRKATKESGYFIIFYHWNLHRKINVLLHVSLSTLLVEKWQAQCADRSTWFGKSKKVIQKSWKIEEYQIFDIAYLFLPKGDILHFFLKFDKFEIYFWACFKW